MEKMQINNQVISMRKLVKQAKVHVMSKLVKEVRLLKRKNGDEAKIAKNKRKAERLLLEINVMKKTSTDAVSKMALSSKDYKHVMSDKSASTEDRVMSRLLSFGPLQKEAQEFNSKFPHLVKMLPNVFQQWEVKKHHHDSDDDKEITMCEIQKRKRRSCKKRLTDIDFGHHDLILNEKFSNGAKENSAAVDIVPVVSELGECKNGKYKNIEPVICKFQQDKKTSWYESVVGEFCGASHDTFPKDENLAEVGKTVNTNSHCRIKRFQLSGVLDSSDYFRKSNNMHNTKYKHRFRKLPYAGKSATSGRTNKISVVSRVHNTNVKDKETTTWNSAGRRNELESKRKGLMDFSKSKPVGVYQRSTMTSCKPDCFEKVDKMSASLHPSWEAKRKMNMCTKNIFPFQGKKVKFDE